MFFICLVIVYTVGSFIKVLQVETSLGIVYILAVSVMLPLCCVMHYLDLLVPVGKPHCHMLWAIILYYALTGHL